MSVVIEELECQERKLYSGSNVTLTFGVLATDYPVASVFDWRLQIFDPNDDTICLVEKTGTATIGSPLTFPVELLDSDLEDLELGVGHPALLKDTTSGEFIAKLCFEMILGDRASPV